MRDKPRLATAFPLASSIGVLRLITPLGGEPSPRYVRGRGSAQKVGYLTKEEGSSAIELLVGAEQSKDDKDVFVIVCLCEEGRPVLGDINTVIAGKWSC